MRAVFGLWVFATIFGVLIGLAAHWYGVEVSPIIEFADRAMN